MIQSDKEIIRRQMRDQLQAQSDEDRGQQSRHIHQTILSLRELEHKEHLFCYLSLKEEVETTHLIDQWLEKGKQVFVPVIPKEKKEVPEFLVSELRNREDELESGPFGIWQPKKEFIRLVQADKLETVIVPGLAFDTAGRRIGRGAGYFDRFLSKIPRSCLKIGIGFDFQVFPEIPTESHDVSLDMIVTDQRIIKV